MSKQNYWKVNKSVGNLAQNHMVGLLLAYLSEIRDDFSKSSSLDEDGGFWVPSETIEKHLFITKEMRQKLTKSLEELQMLKVIKKGLPSRHYYYIQDEIASIGKDV